MILAISLLVAPSGTPGFLIGECIIDLRHQPGTDEGPDPAPAFVEGGVDDAADEDRAGAGAGGQLCQGRFFLPATSAPRGESEDRVGCGSGGCEGLRCGGGNGPVFLTPAGYVRAVIQGKRLGGDFPGFFRAGLGAVILPRVPWYRSGSPGPGRALPSAAGPHGQ